MEYSLKQKNKVKEQSSKKELFRMNLHLDALKILNFYKPFSVGFILFKLLRLLKFNARTRVQSFSYHVFSQVTLLFKLKVAQPLVIMLCGRSTSKHTFCKARSIYDNTFDTDSSVLNKLCIQNSAPQRQLLKRRYSATSNLFMYS